MSILTINNLSYSHPDKTLLFKKINLSVSKSEKISLIGNNGTGKSTLLNIIAGNLKADGGNIYQEGTIYYVPQHFSQYNDLTIAQALKVDDKLRAYNAILNGSTNVNDYNILNDDWEIVERVGKALENLDLESPDFQKKLHNLSGGEKTKIFLAGIYIHNPDIILFDEPTNHLDKKARNILYELIKTSKASMIIVSHDRTLLNLLDTTLELTSNGIISYGGNYEFYKMIKAENLEALQKDVEEKEKELRKAKKVSLESMERQQRRSASGKKKKKKQGVPRIVLNSLKSEAEKTSAKLKDIHTDKISNLVNEVKDLQTKTSSLTSKNLKLNIEDAKVHKGKLLVDVIDVNFSYIKEILWKEPLNFQIYTGDRINISGNNGSGKSTLIKLIFGELKPTIGRIQRNPFSKIYIDQEYSIIDNNITVYEHVEKYNSQNFTETELKSILTHFLFTKDFWDKKCSTLSGGEKMKLLFCCMEIGNAFPDMIGLDEPTNNLDINSLEIITSTLKSYNGSLLIISHDEYFLEEIGVDCCIQLC